MSAAEVGQLRSLGLATIRIKPLGKAPIGQWQNRIDEPAHFQPGENVGVRLGDPSGGLVDIDMDCPEAAALYPRFGPKTAMFGHGDGLPQHAIVRCPGVKTRKPARAQVELRSTGTQTVFPPSIHESGEPIRWVDHTPIGEVDEATLLASFGKLAAATTIARATPRLQDDRGVHDAVLALAGALWHQGWEVEDAVSLLVPALELHGGPDSGHREAAIRDTWDDHGRPRRGWPTLAEIIGPLDAKAIERAVELVPTAPRVTVANGILVGADGAPERIPELDDLGNAARFIRDHVAELRFCHGVGWFRWQGNRWSQPHGEPIDQAEATVRRLQAEAAQLGQATLLKWAKSSASGQRVSTMLNLAKNKTEMRISADALDADPWLFNCANGTLDLRSGALRPHNPADLITKASPVEYSPDAEAPRFLQFLAECMGGDLELVAYLLRFLGYGLTGDVSEHALGVWHGPAGCNGKSTLIELVMHVLGDYAGTIAPDVLLQQRGSQHPTGLMDLRGRRLVCSNEAPEGRRWDESLVKRLTGGDRIKARAMRQDFVEFSPTHKLVLAANSRPLVREQGDAFWRRVQLIPWLVSFRGRENRELPYALRCEAPGVLRCLVWGCQEWLRVGLSPPARVRAAVEDYRESQDTIGAFIEETLEFAGGEFVPRTRVYETYRRWADQNGEYRLPAKALYRILEERGGGRIQSTKLRGARGFRGWRLRPANEGTFGAKAITLVN